MKKMICLLAVLMLTAAIFAGCGQTQEAQVPAETAAQTEAAEETTAVETEAAQTVPETEPQSGVLENGAAPVACFEIETPYCMMTYPMTWQGYILIEQEETVEGCVVSFYGLLEGKENQHLFDVRFGGAEGDLVGQLETEGGSVPVYFKTYSVYENENLTTDEAEMLLAMVEDINTIYTGLQALPQFN